MVDLQTILSALTTAASFAAVAVVVYQVRKTLSWNDDRKVNEDFDKVNTEALKVDAWVVVNDKNKSEKSIIMRNYSVGPVRDVRLLVEGFNEESEPKQEPIPCIAPCLQIVPQGTWLISRDSSKWAFPRRIPEETSGYTPLFAGNNNHTTSKQRVLEIHYTDVYGNKWKREYGRAHEGKDTRPKLLQANQNCFKRFEEK